MLGLLVDFFFPKFCVGCGQIDLWLCDRCRAQMTLAPSRCPYCRQSTVGSQPHCERALGMDGITTLFDYHSGVVRRVIKAIKYDFMPAVINDILTDTELPDVAFDLITFVPLHRRRQNWRGFNQAEKLAERLHQICLLPVAGTLKRGRFTEPLARSRSFNLRVKSVKSAFQLRPEVSLEGKNLILVDDVFTSGATMFEATRVLKQAGAAKVWGWTLAG